MEWEKIEIFKAIKFKDSIKFMADWLSLSILIEIYYVARLNRMLF